VYPTRRKLHLDTPSHRKEKRILHKMSRTYISEYQVKGQGVKERILNGFYTEDEKENPNGMGS